MGRIGQLDWVALISGAVVAFVSFIALQFLLGAMGLYTRPGEPGLRRMEAVFLSVAGPAPGAVLAGYLHTSKMVPGMLYGLLASFFGMTVTTGTAVLTFAVLIGVLSGELIGTLRTTFFFFLLVGLVSRSTVDFFRRHHRRGHRSVAESMENLDIPIEECKWSV